MMHIMNNLPSAYDGSIENLEDRLDSTLDPLIMTVLRGKISEKFEKITRRRGSKDNISMREDAIERAQFVETFKYMISRPIQPLWEVWT